MASTGSVVPSGAAVASAKKAAAAKAAAKKKNKSNLANKSVASTSSAIKVGDLVDAAIVALKESGGSSLPAIKKYIAANHGLDANKLEPAIKKYLKSVSAAGSRTGTFKLSPAEKPTKKTTAVKPKKNSSPKKKKTSPKKKSLKKKSLAARPPKAKKPAKPKKSAKKIAKK